MKTSLKSIRKHVSDIRYDEISRQLGENKYLDHRGPIHMQTIHDYCGLETAIELLETVDHSLCADKAMRIFAYSLLNLILTAWEVHRPHDSQTKPPEEVDVLINSCYKAIQGTSKEAVSSLWSIAKNGSDPYQIESLFFDMLGVYDDLEKEGIGSSEES